MDLELNENTKFGTTKFLQLSTKKTNLFNIDKRSFRTIRFNFEPNCMLTMSQKNLLNNDI